MAHPLVIMEGLPNWGLSVCLSWSVDSGMIWYGMGADE